MTRLGAFLCKLNSHRFTEVDEFNRISCERCAKRKPVRFDTIRDPALAGRELARPKTKGQR